MKSAAIVFEAGYQRGVGHAMRCMVLAEALQQSGWQITLVSNAEAKDFCPKIKEFNHITHDQLMAAAAVYTLIVVDQYSIGYEQETLLREKTTCLMVIDELINRRHNCDILLDQNYGVEERQYRGLVPDACKILVGCGYALLRQEFSQLRDQALSRRRATQHLEKLFINFGGADQKDYTSKVLQQLANTQFTGEVDVVLGFAAPHYETARKAAEKLKNKVNFHQNADMAKLMLAADCSIGAGGSTHWERCCLGLPSLVIQTADNQSVILANMSRDNFCIHIENDLTNLVAELDLLIVDQMKTNELSERSSQLCNGLGSRYVVTCIEEVGLK